MSKTLFIAEAGVQIPARSWQEQGMSDDFGDNDPPRGSRHAGKRRSFGGKPAERRPREYRPREPRPLNAAQLQELALGYAARYATTAAKLRRYLERKLGERLWTPPDSPDIDALVARITGLGYVDDRAYATLKARELAGRGFGQRRVRSTLAAAGISRDDAAAVFAPDASADAAADSTDRAGASPYISAIAFARRRRFGPFARDPASADPVRQRRELAAMARAGHDFDIARRVLAARDEAAALALADDD